MAFVKAGPAEILRSSQKDESVIKTLQHMCEDAFLRVAGTRVSIKYKQHISSLSRLLYYSNTTLCNLQTLGEEYTGIVQVDKTMRYLPCYFSRIMMIIFESFGGSIIQYIIKYLENQIRDNPDILPDAKEKTLHTINLVKRALPFLDNIHKAIFYCNWDSYHLSKRFTGIHYVLVRFWLKDRRQLPAYRILGIITALQLAISAVSSLRQKINEPVPEFNNIESSSKGKNCVMCMNPLQNPTCTPCGHIFCWYCILEWLKEESQCPICRENVKPSRVVALRNYC